MKSHIMQPKEPEETNPWKRYRRCPRSRDLGRAPDHTPVLARGRVRDLALIQNLTPSLGTAICTETIREMTEGAGLRGIIEGRDQGRGVALIISENIVRYHIELDRRFLFVPRFGPYAMTGNFKFF